LRAKGEQSPFAHTAAAELSATGTFLLFLFVYVLGLMAFTAFALGWGSLHHDMTEAWAWGKEFQLGYAKHPPLSAWMAGLWFMVMPRANWSFHLLSSLNVALALGGVWMLAGLFLIRSGRWAAILFLILTPSFSLWSLKFNVNAPLLSTWPWTTYFFLRSLDTRRIDLSVVAGILGAAALLTKYYSLVLFGTLFLVALFHPEGRRYFKSAAPYSAIATGLLLLAPHIWWTIVSGYPTIDYAISKTSYAATEARASALKAVSGALGALGIAVGAYAVAFGIQSWPLLRRSIIATFAKRNAWLVCLAHGPLLFTVAAYLIANARITGGFLIPAFFATPIAFLVLSQAEVTGVILRKLAYCVVAVWLPLLIGSPLLGYYTFVRADNSDIGIEPRQEIAVAATTFWRSTFGAPLRYVAGEEPLATATTFYSSDAPSYFMLDRPDYSPWITMEQAKKVGLLIICPATAQHCLDAAATFVGDQGIRLSRELTTRFFGRTARPQPVVFIVQPPASHLPPR
jgi:4-amino-4-deoxy-L-arabinose transferase-like glycosyltransferase